MRIAIVEDEEVHSSLLHRYILAWGTARGKAIRVQVYVRAENFLFDLEDHAPDAVFADIQMPGMNGMEMVHRLREKDSQMPVIFTTGLSDYLQEGYEVQALHYLLKPITEEKVFACMDRICTRKDTRKLYTVKTCDGMARLDLNAVNYCEAEGHYARFLMTDYLCNLENVRQIMEDSVIFDNGALAPVSRRLYRELNRKFIEHYRQGG